MFEEYIAPHGPLNLFSYFPRGSIIPDLGTNFITADCIQVVEHFFSRTKTLYIPGQFHFHQTILNLIVEQADLDGGGTTLVHMDKSGAINIMLYSKPDSHGDVSGAHWDIWPASSIPSLSKALDTSASDESCKMGQAIVSEMHYISPDVSRTAFLSSGIQGWHAIQLPGEAIIIPPGCPHQVSSHLLMVHNVTSFLGEVSNRSSCFKIAVDFVSPSHIPVLDMLRDAFRMMNVEEHMMVHDDLLQQDVMLWYAWEGTL
jgi:hypothetical protein